MIPTHFRRVTELRAWPDNYNKNDINLIARSIRRFGFNTALRVWQNTVMAGNHSFMALDRIRLEGGDPELDRDWPPANVIVHEGEWYVDCVDVSHLDNTEVKAFAIADNSLARKAVADEAMLAEYLQEIAAHDEQMFLTTGYDHADLEALINNLTTGDDITDEGLDPDEYELQTGTSDGSLLALTHVTIAAPRHAVEKGDVWHLGNHVLICADVLTGWEQWVKFLKGDTTIFTPYPGPFVPLTVKADAARFVMVQPDTYIAGHILDRYTDIKGAGSVQKAN